MTEVTQENLFLLLPGKVSNMAMIYAEQSGLPVVEAMRQIYRSDTYRQLEQENTKLWHYGPVALYEMFREEQNKTLSFT